MRARQQTEQMLQWWKRAGVSRADMAVRRRDGVMAWHRDLPLVELPLGWARAENAAKGDVYIRPARGQAWPVVFLDDVAVDVAARVVLKYAALIVATSPEGGSHLWLRCRRPLDEEARHEVQRWLADRTGADRASTSGEHLGRLAGFRNWKRGTWVNVHDAVLARPAWDPDRIPRHGRSRPPAAGDGQPLPPARTSDSSESGREWGWVCGLLEAGFEPSCVQARLQERARRRRGEDAARYAQHTVRRALARVTVHV
jgi:hypothetical protein